MNQEVQSFMDAVPADRKPLFDRLHALITGLYPDAEVVISNAVPTYRAKPGWVALGYWKSGVSLYTNGPHGIAGSQLPLWRYESRLPSWPILNGLRQMMRLDLRHVLQVRNRPRQLQDAVERPCAHAQL